MFELALPWVLLALPLPWFIWFFMSRAPLHLPAALKVPFYHAVASIVETEKHGLARRKGIALLFFIWCLLLLALAGPRWVGEPEPIAREGYNIMLALDLSGSMELTDMLVRGRPVSRLSVVKHTAEQFVAERKADKMGLILFGSRAYLQTPLTYDRENLLTRIEDATVGLAGKTTSIGDALGLAVKHLQNVPKEGRIIILLTDGANNSGVLTPIKAAELARTDDIKVYTIGLGSEADPRAINSLFFNMNAAADLDEETLQKVADITGGRYFRATDMQSLQNIYDTINRLERVSQDEETIRPQHDYYYWPLSLALVLFFYWLAYEAGVLPRRMVQRNQEALS
ncbi:VWA domain-containing protein [Legionella impletisoli]|uniref:VWFA domain-containing protein n=1 Tax=Legionella impletisoli TaxID=343510 RepID=A0A917JTA9_9GAMM|nr:VWA domain-containing protein [Legionella impletisoli]GGI84739.1 hypothetical protein GCM10007966_11640 [Legionella impletisoli]